MWGASLSVQLHGAQRTKELEHRLTAWRIEIPEFTPKEDGGEIRSLKKVLGIPMALVGFGCGLYN